MGAIVPFLTIPLSRELERSVLSRTKLRYCGKKGYVKKQKFFVILLSRQIRHFFCFFFAAIELREIFCQKGG